LRMGEGGGGSHCHKALASPPEFARLWYLRLHGLVRLRAA